MGYSVRFRTCPDFDGFLERNGGHADMRTRFTARNFGLDPSVPDERVSSYRASGAGAAHSDAVTWERTHKGYLYEFVNRPSVGPSPRVVDTTDPFACPETFSSPAASPFASSDPGLELLRVESVVAIAGLLGVDPPTLLALARDKARVRDFDSHLAAWSDKCDRRPVFAGFRADFGDLFGAGPTGDRPGWEDTLRDRLGLAHYNPDPIHGTRPPVDIFVFRYRVSEIPPLSSRPSSAPLVPPTVLDQMFNTPFCPAPAGQSTGFTIDLSGRRPGTVREVLHPRPALGSRHLFRVGQVRAPVADDQLEEARRLHLHALRSLDPTWAVGTDGS